MVPFIGVIAHIGSGNPEQVVKLAFSVLGIPFVSAPLAIRFCALRTLRFGEREAFLTVVLIGLATPLWHYGRSGQEENIIGLAFAWSYSLYVMHPAASRLSERLLPTVSSGAEWLLRIPLILGACYLFYLAVEKPSHRLARAAANALRPPVVARVAPLA